MFVAEPKIRPSEPSADCRHGEGRGGIGEEKNCLDPTAVGEWRRGGEKRLCVPSRKESHLRADEKGAEKGVFSPIFTTERIRGAKKVRLKKRGLDPPGGGHNVPYLIRGSRREAGRDSHATSRETDKDQGEGKHSARKGKAITTLAYFDQKKRGGRNGGDILRSVVNIKVEGKRIRKEEGGECYAR